ncbi:Uncharacterised protein [uncultured archaeon]|nr:Uncharacterised protein [uncultured archaeon]
MPQYNINPQIIEKSIEELEFILKCVKRRGETSENPKTILIGGWAVDAYNPWYGSVDIDLVTNSEMKSDLKYYLKKLRNYGSYELDGGFNTISKMTEYGEIIIDFVKRERYTFVGREEKLDFKIPKEQTVIKGIRGRISAVVPTRSMLMLLKLKASWDRTHRIEHGRSIDIDWERSKRIKDYADIIALIDPVHGGRDIDTGFLGEKFVDLYCLRLYRCRNLPILKYPDHPAALGHHYPYRLCRMRDSCDR